GQTEIQERGYLLVRPPFGEEMQDFFLAIGQQVVRVTQPAFLQGANVILDEEGCDGGAEVVPAGGHGAKGGEQILVSRVLQEVRADTSCKRANDVRLVGVHAQDDYARRSIKLLRPSRNFDAVHHRHADVDDQQVRAMLLEEPNRLETVSGLG